ncbi:MAG: AAA family ATPase [Bdellovibrionota bacterium]
MVFIGGPRQVGKTTLAISLLGPGATEKHPGYLNWDHPLTPARLRAMELPPRQELIVLDEIHKYARWRNLVKGIYDTEKSSRKIIVTGSARLDYYRKGGDSLANRYRYFRLHPLSLVELAPKNPTLKDLNALMKFSGFPEPLCSQSEAEWRIWQRDRMTRVVKEDLRDLENVREISLLEHLAELLPTKVGSPLFIKSLREDLAVDHKTVERWIQIFENLYVCFRIAPFGNPRIRAVKKEKKVYLWDWTMVENPGARLENLVASQLLKYCHWIEDTQGFRMELRFLRDTDGREVDFVVLKQAKPLFAVECKTGEGALSPAIRYFAERTQIPRFYQVHLGEKEHQSGRAFVLPFIRFCQIEKMP